MKAGSPGGRVYGIMVPVFDGLDHADRPKRRPEQETRT